MDLSIMFVIVIFMGNNAKNYIIYCFVIHTKILFNKLTDLFVNNNFLERIIFLRRERGEGREGIARADTQAPK